MHHPIRSRIIPVYTSHSLMEYSNSIAITMVLDSLVLLRPRYDDDSVFSQVKE